MNGPDDDLDSAAYITDALAAGEPHPRLIITHTNLQSHGSDRMCVASCWALTSISHG